MRGKKIDLNISGKGKTTEILVNGKKREGAEVVIPFRKLKAHNKIVIRRK